MARYNEILVGRYNRFVQKLFSMKGPASLATLSDEMMSVFPFTNGVENRYLEGWQRFGVRTQPPAVAAQFAAFQLRNPSTSNVLAVVESCVVFNSITDNPTIFAGQQWTTDLGSSVQNGPLDLRQSINAQSSCITTRGSNAAVGGGQGNSVRGISFVANDSKEFIQTDNQEMPIAPGSGFGVWSNTVNQAFTVSVIWRERFLEDSERT